MLQAHTCSRFGFRAFLRSTGDLRAVPAGTQRCLLTSGTQPPWALTEHLRALALPVYAPLVRHPQPAPRTPHHESASWNLLCLSSQNMSLLSLGRMTVPRARGSRWWRRFKTLSGFSAPGDRTSPFHVLSVSGTPCIFQFLPPPCPPSFSSSNDLSLLAAHVKRLCFPLTFYWHHTSPQMLILEP